MTEIELNVVKGELAYVLEMGAPGLSADTRAAIVSAAVRRIGYHLNVPKPPLTPQHRANEP